MSKEAEELSERLLQFTPRRPKDRLTVIDSVYHQAPGKDPDQYETKFSRPLESEEQVYDRDLIATEEWTQLDKGWIESCSQLLIMNTEGKTVQTILSQEENSELAEKILEIRQGTEVTWLVPPKESVRGIPANLDTIFIRCRKGTANYTVVLFPR